ncbi:Leaf rust 10 disease-resistance locus receptor-like protein kinase [Melia azedarach]|uniref:Leaf rust 10 disease-resistance locus receptor-like protein kinase n=1 Tax=Melia azedarach TaxID=155640 RepID=A0ACC1X6I7_MELAZ|nr:Leaf rust 10 disease-resistance locus receptor-like protein kinase [Melia azedarach]
MNLHLCPRLILSLMTTTAIFVLVPITVLAIDGQYSNCSALFHCANIQIIGYPFCRGTNRPEYCAYPGFELDCQGDVPGITILDITYRILKIDNKLQTITSARDDYWNMFDPRSSSIRVVSAFSIMLPTQKTNTVL